MRYRRTIGVTFSPHALRISEGPHGGDHDTEKERLLLPPDASEAQRMIDRYVSENRLGGIPAILGLPAETVYMSLLQPPAGGRQAREAAIREHLNGLDALSGSETVSDVTPIPSTGGPRPVLLGVARLDAVHALLDPLTEAGITIEAAVPTSLACFNFAALQLPRRQARLVVLCPVSESGIEVLAGTTESLLGVWRIPISPTPQPRPDPALPTFGAELENAWRSVSGIRTPPPDVVWCADTPLPDFVTDDLTQTIGTAPVPIADWERNPRQWDASGFLTRALAHQEADHSRMHLDLLPPPMRERARRRALLPFQFAAALLFAAFAGTLSIYEFRRSHTIRSQLTHAEKQWQNRLDLQEQDARLKQRIDALSDQVVSLRNSALSPLLIRDLLIAIADARHPDDWIVRIADAQSYFDALPSPAQKVLENEPAAAFMFDPQVFIVEGYTPGADLASVRSLIEMLRTHPRIEAVDLLGDDRVGPDRTPELFQMIPASVHRFVMEIRIREP